MWFSYDPDGSGMVFHDSPKKAKLVAEGALQLEADDACDEPGWSENVTSICWGSVSEIVVETNRKEKPPAEELDDDHCDEDGTYWGVFEEIVEYDLRKPEKPKQ